MIHKTKDSIARINYDRSFLLALRLSPLSLIKPCSCEDYDVILNEPIILDNSNTHRPCKLTEDYFSHVQNKHVITGISLQNDQKLLHVSEKPWKPAHKDPQNSEYNKNLESAVLYIMNRLTPSNFQKLADEMMALEIKSFEDLELVVSTVFEKVALEPKFVQAYASLCKVMLGLQVEPPPTIPKNKATFRAVLVTKCQKVFEADKTFNFEDPEETKRRIMEEMTEDTPARAEKIEKALYQMKLNQLKFFGNISFIGELFKLGILPEVIIHSCIVRLLSCTDDESLFSLCKLLTGVGKNIDTRKTKAQIDKYFVRIAQLADASKSRLKFALRDVLDLRKSKWVPRNKAAGPKTISEIHKDFKEEKSVTEISATKPPKKSVRFETREAPLRENISTVTASKHSISCDSPAPKKDDRVKLANDSDKENEDSWSEVKSKGKSAKLNNKKNKSSKEVKKIQEVTKSIPVVKSFDVIPKVHEDFTVPKKSNAHSAGETSCSDQSVLVNNNQQNVETLDITRFKLSKSKAEDDIVLAPGGRTTFSSILCRFGRDKSRDADRLSECEKKTVNRFSLLLDVSDEECSEAEPDNAVDFELTKHVANPVETHDTEVDRELSSEFPDSESMHRTDKVNALDIEKPTFPLTEEELETKSQNLIDEYISCRDIQEVFLCVKELKEKADLGSLVTITVNYVLEKTDAIRQLIAELFCQLLQADLLSVDNIIKGFSEVMALAEDIVVDVPKLWTYLAQLISPLLSHLLPWSYLDPIISPLMSPHCSALMLAHIFKILQHRQTIMTDLQDGWRQSGLQWETFLENDKVINFLSEHNIKDIFVSSIEEEEEMHQLENNGREDSGSVVLIADQEANKCDGSNKCDRSNKCDGSKNVQLLTTEVDSGKSLEMSNDINVRPQSDASSTLSEVSIETEFTPKSDTLCVTSEVSIETEFTPKSDTLCVTSEVSIETEFTPKSDTLCVTSEVSIETEFTPKSDTLCVTSEVSFETEFTPKSDTLCVTSEVPIETEFTPKSDTLCVTSEVSNNIDIPIQSNTPCVSPVMSHETDIRVKSASPCETSKMSNLTDVRVESDALRSDASFTDPLFRNPDNLHLKKYLEYPPTESVTGETSIENPIQLSEDEIHADHEGEEVWRREMLEDKTDFYTHVSILSDSAKKIVYCVPFKLEEQEEEKCTLSDISANKVNDTSEAKFVAPHVIEVSYLNSQDKDVEDNNWPAEEISVYGEEQVMVLPEDFHENSSQCSTLYEASTKGFQTDMDNVHSNPWSTVYLDVDKIDDAVSSSEEEIFYSDKSYFDGYFQTTGGLYTFEDHQRYLKWLDSVKENTNLSAEASCFFPPPHEDYNQVYSEQTSEAPFVKKLSDPKYKTDNFYYNNYNNEDLSKIESAGFTHTSQSIPQDHDPVFATQNHEVNSPFHLDESNTSTTGQINPFEFLMNEPRNCATQPNSDMVRFLVQCQQAAYIVEGMLRNKSSNRDILKLMQEEIMGTDIERALLAIFMTALAYYSLHDASGDVVKERKEIIKFLLGNDQSREVEAVQILHLVLCHLSNPQGISVLLQALFSEKLVSLNSLKMLFNELNKYIRDNGIKCDNRRQNTTQTQDQSVLI